jgi:HEPN domain-containing protein
VSSSADDFQEWLRIARDDLTAARKLLADPEVAPRQSCYLAQQAAEKAIKAALVFHCIEFPYRHDLEYLNDLLPLEWQVDSDTLDLEQLTEWVVLARYPGDHQPATVADAENAVEHARRIVESIETRLHEWDRNSDDVR